MTEQPEPKRILKVAELAEQLPEEEHLRLGNAVGGGLFNARMAAQCLTDPDRQHENVLQMLTYLTTAIRELQAARDILQRQS